MAGRQRDAHWPQACDPPNEIDTVLRDAVVYVARIESLKLESAPACLLQARGATSADDCELYGTQCAICLEDIDLADLAAIKGCEHIYCVTCILQWATARKKDDTCASCPTCKTPIHSLLVHRDVDGELSDSPLDMTLGFLARAPWYVAWANERSQITQLTRQNAALRSVDAAEGFHSAAALAQEEYADEALYDFFESEYDELEDDYFLSGSGSSANVRRVVFTNRRFGEGGYICSGRRQAQPVQQPRVKGKGSNKQRSGGSSSSSGKAGAAASSSKGACGGGYGRGNPARGGAGNGSVPPPPEQGRRAARKAKRAARDHAAF